MMSITAVPPCRIAALSITLDLSRVSNAPAVKAPVNLSGLTRAGLRQALIDATQARQRERALLEFERDGCLEKLSLAFSRDQKEKVYVQHKVRDAAPAVLEDLGNAFGRIRDAHSADERARLPWLGVRVGAAVRHAVDVEAERGDTLDRIGGEVHRQHIRRRRFAIALAVGFGGHAHACGVTLPESALEEFRARMLAKAAEMLTPDDLRKEIDIDALVTALTKVKAIFGK